jgi:hypothetical protein
MPWFALWPRLLRPSTVWLLLLLRPMQAVWLALMSRGTMRRVLWA